MEKLNMTLSDKIEASLEKELKEALKDEEFAKLVKRIKITKDIAKKNTSKLQDTCNELNNCKNCKGLFACQNKLLGHVLYPEYCDDSL